MCLGGSSSSTPAPSPVAGTTTIVPLERKAEPDTSLSIPETPTPAAKKSTNAMSAKSTSTPTAAGGTTGTYSGLTI